MLSPLLNLDEGLRPHYVRPRVRIPVRDEWSERIKTGTIIAETRRYKMNVSPATLEQARAAHAKCEAVLRRSCEPVAK
jgi:hypothetical protein